MSESAYIYIIFTTLETRAECIINWLIVATSAKLEEFNVFIKQ